MGRYLAAVGGGDVLVMLLQDLVVAVEVHVDEALDAHVELAGGLRGKGGGRGEGGARGDEGGSQKPSELVAASG